MPASEVELELTVEFSKVAKIVTSQLHAHSVYLMVELL